jgi:hypothetical protein
MKHKNGQMEKVGDSYAKANPQVWKQHKEEEVHQCKSLIRNKVSCTM